MKTITSAKNYSPGVATVSGSLQSVQSNYKPNQLSVYTHGIKFSEENLTGSIAINAIPEILSEGPKSSEYQLVSHEFTRVVTAVVMAEASLATGGYIKLYEEQSYLPMIIDKEEKMLPLFALVEIFDEFINYEDIVQSYSNISYEHIHGAMNFFRKLAQSNIKGIDIDELENRIIASDEELIKELERAFDDKGTEHVLNRDKFDR